MQAANGTLSTSDNEALDAEFQQLVKEIDRIAQNTTWARAAILMVMQQVMKIVQQHFPFRQVWVITQVLMSLV